MPRVSVIIPNYNHARYLEQRIRSVLDQTFQDFEVIILDDASTDNSREIIERFRGHPRVARIEYNARNSGSPFKQWNKGVALARGEYIWIAEADDWAEPRFLACLVPVLDANPGVGLAYCGSRVVDADGARIGSCHEMRSRFDPARWERDFISGGREECARYLAVMNTIPNASAVLLRRPAFVRAGGAPGDMRYCGDYMTWIRILLGSDVAFLAERLNHFRQHGNSVRDNPRLTRRAILENYWVAGFVSSRVSLPREQVEAIRRHLFEWWWKEMRRPAGGRWFRHLRILPTACRFDPAVCGRIWNAWQYEWMGRSRLLLAAARGYVSMKSRFRTRR